MHDAAMASLLSIAQCYSQHPKSSFGRRGRFVLWRASAARVSRALCNRVCSYYRTTINNFNPTAPTRCYVLVE
jgi:hypothetical protein